MNSEKLKAVYRYYDAWNTGDLSAIDEVMSDDFVGHEFGQGQALDKTTLKELAQQHRNLFPSFRVDAEDVLEQGDRIALRWRATLENESPSQRRPLTTGIVIYRFHDNRIAEFWSYWDTQRATDAA